MFDVVMFAATLSVLSVLDYGPSEIFSYTPKRDRRVWFIGLLKKWTVIEIQWTSSEQIGTMNQSGNMMYRRCGLMSVVN